MYVCISACAVFLFQKSHTACMEVVSIPLLNYATALFFCVVCIQADQLLRETHPIALLSKDGQMLDAVFFEQFRSMLVDANT